MPLKSQAQRAWMHMHHPKMADRWEKHTPKGKKLPKHAHEGAPAMGAVFGEAEDTDRQMAAASHGEEQQAIRDYDRRERDASSPSLRHVFKHAGEEERQHAKMLKQWMGEAKDDIPDPEDNAHLPDPEEEGEEFVKTAPIHAVQMDEPFEVETVEGPMDGKAGDWLAKGHNGDMWVVDDELFRDTHAPAGPEDEPLVDEADAHRSGEPLPPVDPENYQIWQSPSGYHLLTPEGNEQWFDTEDKRDRYLQWHQGMSGKGGVKQALPGGPPKLESVFRLREAPVQNRPPPGSQPVRPTEWNQLGQMGQSLDKGLKAMQSAGQTTKVFKTPQGDRIAYPDDAAPGRGPLKADTTKGVWTPMTGSATGTPTTPFTPTTSMK